MPETDASEVNRSVIERFYNELWNGWSLAVADKIVSENLRFRGSLGSTLEGLEGFKDYVRTVRDAFPDWHNRIDELIVCGDRVVTRMTWSGTHRGTLLGVEPTGKRVEYVGTAKVGRGMKRVQSSLGGCYGVAPESGGSARWDAGIRSGRGCCCRGRAEGEA